MLITKLPKTINPALPKITPPTAKRQFLTKPSSWAKMGVIVSVVIVLFIVNRSPQSVPAQNTAQTAESQPGAPQPVAEVTPDAEGVVAGVESVRDIQPTPEPEAVKKTQPEIPKTQPDQPPAPSKAQVAMQAILGDDQELQPLLVLGKKYLDEERLDTAELAFMRATEVAPEYRDAWYLVGFTALKEFQKNPVVQSPDFTVSKLDLAIIYLKHAKTIDPLAQNVKDLLKSAQDIQSKG